MDELQRQMAFAACAKAGKAGGLRTGALVLRGMVERDITSPGAMLKAAADLEAAAARLDAEVEGVLPPSARINH